MLLGQNLSPPSFLFFLSTWPNTDSPAVSLLPSFLGGPMAQLAFPACSPGSPGTVHPKQHHPLRRVKTVEFSPSHYLKQNRPNLK
jgi:hypothetical protein